MNLSTAITTNICDVLFGKTLKVVDEEVSISIINHLLLTRFLLIELDVIGNICESLDKKFEITSKHRKIMEDEYDSQFEDYREIIQDQKAQYVNAKLSKLPISDK